MLADIVKSTFNAAKESGAVVFTESEKVKSVVDGIQFLYTLAPALAKKPKSQITTETSQPQVAKSSPWVPPEQALTVQMDFETDYRIVLNKFAVTPRHFLLITKEPQPQTSPLSPEDLSAAFKLLAEVNKSKRHLGFFNCGADSGASVAHKHIQFMEFPEDFTPFVDELVDVNPTYKEGQRPFSDTRMSFAHFVVPIPAHPTPDDLGFRYSTIMSRVLTMLRQAGNSISYNIVFTERWMMGVPRSSETCEGRSINSVGTIGMFLAKSQEDLEFYQQKGPLNVLQEVGLPPVDIEQKEDEYDY